MIGHSLKTSKLNLFKYDMHLIPFFFFGVLSKMSQGTSCQPLFSGSSCVSASAHPKWNTTTTSCIFQMCWLLPTMSSQVGVFCSSVISCYQGGHDHYDNASCRPPAPGLQPLHLETHQCCTEATSARLSCSNQGLHQREANEALASGTKFKRHQTTQ